MVSMGHSHPKLVAALTEQAQRLWHVSNLYEIPEQSRYAERLADASFADASSRVTGCDPAGARGASPAHC